MASFTGTKVKDTYPAILKVSDNGALDGTLQTITDGLGNNSTLSLSTSAASIGGTLAVAGAATFSGALNGTISTAAQPNITSVGTLSSLAVSGNLVVDTNTLYVDATKESVGIGIAPFENSLSTSMDFEGGGGIFAYGNGVYFNGNLYYDGAWKLKASGAASNYLSDGNHIFYTTPSGTAGDSVSTVERMRIDNSGNVGIGASPSTISTYRVLELKGPNTSTGGMFRTAISDNSTIGKFYTNSTGTWVASETSHPLIFETSNSERMRIDSNGYVNCNANTATDNPPYAQGISFGWNKSNSQGEAMINFTNAGGGLDPSLTFNYWDNSTFSERMRIDSSGNVGIGTDSNLNLGISGLRGLSIYGSSYSGLQLRNSSGNFEMAVGLATPSDVLIRNNMNGNLRFGTNGSERVRITSGGYLKASNDGSYGGVSSSYHELVSNAADQTLYLLNLNLAADGLLLNLNTDGTTHYFFRGYSNSAGANKILIYTNGNVVNANNSYGAISDAKLKENITDASPKLDKLMQVKVRNYNLIGDELSQIGVVAQELEEVFPSMISESPDTEERQVEVRDEEGNIVYKTEQVLVSEAVEAVYEEVIHPAEEAVYEEVLHPAEDALFDAEGNEVVPAKEEWVEQVLISEAKEEWTEQVLVSPAIEAVYETITLDEPEMTTEKFDLGTVTKSVKYSVFVPILIKAMQEQQEIIEGLKARIEALEA